MPGNEAGTAGVDLTTSVNASDGHPVRHVGKAVLASPPLVATQTRCHFVETGEAKHVAAEVAVVPPLE